MLPTLVLTMSLAPGVDVFGGARSDPTGPKAYPPVYVPAEDPYGYLYQPAYDLHMVPRGAAERYCPQPGDVLLLADPDPLFDVLYVLSRTGMPGHAGVVVRMADGRLGLLEAGFSFTPFTRVTPLEYTMNLYAGWVWARPRETPLTPEQDRRLAEFAQMADGSEYNLKRFAAQITFFRSRAPVVTRFAGKPVGPGKEYTCVQIVVEALVYAGLVTRRPPGRRRPTPRTCSTTGRGTPTSTGTRRWPAGGGVCPSCGRRSPAPPSAAAAGRSRPPRGPAPAAPTSTPRPR
jgi:hypothetical protein